MKILHVASSLSPSLGGVSHAIKSFALLLNANSTHNEVVCLDAPSAGYLKNEQFTIHALGTGTSMWGYNPELLTWLDKNIGRFDAIIVNGLWQYHSYATWLALKKFKRRFPEKPAPKLLVMPHGMLDPYFQRAQYRRFKAIRNWIYWKLIEGKVVNDADGLLFTCETELLLARQPFTPYHPKNEYNVGYGIESPPPFTESMTAAFTDRCKHLDNAPYLLFLSRIDRKKGVDLLISAYIKIHKLNPGKTIPKLVIAGPGLDTSFGEKIQTLVAAANMTDWIYFPGMCIGDAKWGAFYGCEAFILPSHQENFGIVVAESLACGKPVLISNQINIWPEVKNGGAGLVEDDTTEGVKNMLQNWIDLPEDEKKGLHINALKTFENEFTIEKVGRKLLATLSN